MKRFTPQSYVVENGDTLGTISKRFLDDESKWKLIARANHIQKPEHLAVGTRLEIPATSTQPAPHGYAPHP